MGSRWGAGKENGEGRGRGEVTTQATWDQSGRDRTMLKGGTPNK